MSKEWDYQKWPGICPQEFVGAQESYLTPVLLALPFWWEKQIYLQNQIMLAIKIQVLPGAREEMWAVHWAGRT